VINTGVSRTSTVFKLKGRPAIVGPRNEADYQILESQEAFFNSNPDSLKEVSDQYHHPKSPQLLPEEKEKKEKFNPLHHPDTLLGIFGFMDSFELCKCAQVCKAWKTVADGDQLWKAQAIKRYRYLCIDLMMFKMES
jgi:hypothetical protein